MMARDGPRTPHEHFLTNETCWPGYADHQRQIPDERSAERAGLNIRKPSNFTRRSIEPKKCPDRPYLESVQTPRVHKYHTLTECQQENSKVYDAAHLFCGRRPCSSEHAEFPC
jgi:hypothetical protein